MCDHAGHMPYDEHAGRGYVKAKARRDDEKKRIWRWFGRAKEQLGRILGAANGRPEATMHTRFF